MRRPRRAVPGPGAFNAGPKACSSPIGQGKISTVLALAALFGLLLTPLLAFAQEPAGTVKDVKGHAVVIRAGQTPQLLTANDTVYFGDRITTDDHGALRLLLPPTAQVEQPTGLYGLSLTVWQESAVTVDHDDRGIVAVLAVGSVSFFRGLGQKRPPVTIRTSNAIAGCDRPPCGATVSTAIVPQVADGSVIPWSNICALFSASGGAIGASVSELASECITITDEASGRAQSVYRPWYPTEHWRLYRQLRGTGRWIHADSFPTREPCQEAADRQHSLGRQAICRFRTGWPEPTATVRSP